MGPRFVTARSVSHPRDMMQDMKDLDGQAAAIAARQGGTISHEQVKALGFTRHQVEHRSKVGRWVALGCLGYSIFPPRDHIDRLLACVALSPDAVVSHESAAELHNFPSIVRDLAVVTVHTRTTHSFAGVSTHRCHDLATHHTSEIAGLAVTTVARTVVDLASVITPKHLRWMVSKLISDDALDVGELAVVVGDVARRGRKGSATLRSLLAELTADNGKGSKLEIEGRRLIAEAGLPTPEHEHPIPWSPHRRWDDAYVKQQIVIEWDSLNWHLRTDAFEVDRQRDRTAQLHGWLVLRFTWRDVMERPHEVIADVSRALAGRETV